MSLPEAPDPALVAAALEAARDQGPDVEGHGLRTWLFGGALAIKDGVALDWDLFCVGSIVHDAGGANYVDGEDFTIRSAQTATRAFELAGQPLDAERARQLRDAVVRPCDRGVTPGESSLGTCIQARALLDLAGIRLIDLPKETVEEVFRRHPAGDVKKAIVRVLRQEAAAVPEGRSAQLRRLGLTLAVRTSPSLRGRSKA